MIRTGGGVTSLAMVNPARAGMIRLWAAFSLVSPSKPRASGDDPSLIDQIRAKYG